MYELIIYRIADGKEKFMNKTEKNFYELFGIDKNASDEVIKKHIDHLFQNIILIYIKETRCMLKK